MPQSATADHLVITCPFHEHIYIRELVWAEYDFHLRRSNQWPRLEVGGWRLAEVGKWCRLYADAVGRMRRGIINRENYVRVQHCTKKKEKYNPSP